MRIRTIKPDIFASEDVTALSWGARWTFVGLLSYADDKGRARDDARLIKAAIWPIEDAVTPEVIRAHLDEIEKRSMICFYQIDDKRFFHLVHFGEHQKINRPTPSKLPDCFRVKHGHRYDGDQYTASSDEYRSLMAQTPSPQEVMSETPALTEPSTQAHDRLTTGKEGKGREGKGKELLRRGEQKSLPPNAETLFEIDAVKPVPDKTTKAILGALIDARTHRPSTGTLGRVGRIVKQFLADGIPYELVLAAVLEWNRKGSGPSALPGFIDGQVGKQSAHPTFTECPEHDGRPWNNCQYCGEDHGDRAWHQKLDTQGH